MIVQTMPPTTGTTVTPAEFRTIREYMGFTLDEIAAYLGLSPRTVRNWEQGKYPIADGAAAELHDLVAFTHSYIDARSAEATGPLATYRSDAALHRAHPELSRYPSRWHRHVTAAIAHRTGARIEFPE
jgi:transcriptional regulator with XRE-family HTH domain